jgi:transposase
VSLTPEQRALVLYLYHVEGVSIVLIAAMTGHSRSTVSRLLHETRRQDVPQLEKAAAMRPSSKGRIEHQIHCVRASLLWSSEVASRPSKRGGRHDRT